MPPLLHSLDSELQISVGKFEGELGRTIQAILFVSISLINIEDIDVALLSVSFDPPKGFVLISEQALMGW